MRILITDKFDDEARFFLEKKKFSVDYKPEITPLELLEEIENYEGLIVRSRTKVSKEIIERARKLKIIARAGSGTDNIDKSKSQEKGIAVINAPGANAQAVAELTLGLILSLIRKIPQADASLREGKWIKKDLLGSEIYNKTVGVIGFGHVGKKVTALARAFGANVIVVGSHDEDEKLAELLKKSDIVSLHVRLNERTRGFINKEKLALMNKTSYLINCSRGEVIVEDDLFAVLKEKRIAGAALDVFWQEPLSPQSKWRRLENVILTPHIAGQTKEAAKKSCMMVVADMVKFLQGKVINSRVI